MANWIKSGIYKITNPVGQVYVGSTVNLVQRFSYHKGLHCKNNTRLYKSLLKYGVENHIFEVIEYCNKESLRERERYHADQHECLGKDTGLNTLIPSNGESKCSTEEYRLKISERADSIIEKNHFIRTVFDSETGIYYRSISEAANSRGFKRERLRNRINRGRQNRYIALKQEDSHDNNNNRR